MKAITFVKSFSELSKDEQQEINECDLRELKAYYGSWEEVREVIERLEENDNEAAWERSQNRQ